MLGRDLARTAPAEVVVQALHRGEADVTDRAGVERAIKRFAPDIVLNAAAYTAVDRAESEREAAEAVNALAVGSLATLSRQAGALMVHFSTDYVFPGNGTAPYTETAATDPINVYGATKLRGEQAIAEQGGDHLLIRTQWLFGTHGKSFPMTMRDRALRGDDTRVVADQRGRPTYTLDLSRATWELIARRARGTYHVANDGDASWFELAAYIFERVGSRGKLTRCSTAEYPTPATRPRYSVLGTARMEHALGRVLPHWKDAVERFLGELEAARSAS